MGADKHRESDVKVEIQKTLISINQLALRIKNELDVINELIMESGQLHTAVITANKTLTAVAESMDVNIKNVLCNTEEEEEDQLQINLRNPLPSAVFQKKIISCLSDI